MEKFQVSGDFEFGQGEKHAEQEEGQSSEECFLLLYGFFEAPARKARGSFRKWHAVISGNCWSSMDGKPELVVTRRK